MPARTRPYLYLTRIDKPIGTMLLFYPCGTYPLSMCDLLPRQASKYILML